MAAGYVVFMFDSYFCLTLGVLMIGYGLALLIAGGALFIINLLIYKRSIDQEKLKKEGVDKRDKIQAIVLLGLSIGLLFVHKQMG